MATTKGQRVLIRALAAKRRRSETVKPTAAEQKLVDAELRRKYPMMFERPAGEVAMFRGLSTTERKKLLRMVDKKLKGLRGSKKTYELKEKYK